MLPIVPLDGSKIINLLLEKFFSYNLSYKLNVIISFFSLFIFLLLNYIYHLDNYFIITFLLYKIIENIKNYKYLYQRFLLERYLYNFNYHKIDNNTKDLKDLRKDVLHYFKEDNKYIKEKVKLSKLFHNY